MADRDTSLGGVPGGFPRTTLGLFSRMRNPQEAVRRESLEILCRRYWKPVYRFIRIAWAKSNEDAKDLTQAFFLWLIEGETLALYAPERGSFRGFLKHLLSRFVGNQLRALEALKRGGAVAFVALDDEGGLLRETLADGGRPSPDEAFDLEWQRTLVEHAVARVRQSFAAAGRDIQFRAYEAYELAPAAGKPSYADVAARLGVGEGDVRRSLEAVREALGAELRRELAETTDDERGLEEEWRAVFGS